MSTNPLVTVLTPPTSIDLTVLSRVKEELQIQGNAEDNRLRWWITDASDFLAGKLNRVLAQRTISAQWRLTRPRKVLILPQRPVTSIVSVIENDVTLTADDYELDNDAGMLIRLASDHLSFWACGKIVVQLIAGYALLDGLPRGIERGCIMLVKHIRDAATRDPFMKSLEIDIPGVYRKQVDYWVGSLLNTKGGDALPPEVREMIDLYREPNFC